MTNSKILGVIVILGATFSMAAQADSYEWKDDNGVTQIGEVVPPEFTSKIIKHLDSNGRVIKDKLPSDMNAPAIQTAEQKAAMEQRRKDKALMNTYSNEKEIDLARDRNLQQVEALINSIQLRQKTAQDSLDSYHKEASGVAAGRPIPASLQADINDAEDKMTRLQQELDTANEKAASVKASFEADKARYRELTTSPKK
ncbi:MAG: hypothetical protein WDM70_04135 [Nitrosomonadales bacterium]